MNQLQLGKLAVSILLLASGVALAKGEPPAAVALAAPDGAATISHRSPSATARKREATSSKGQLVRDPASEGTKDPYAVPLFKGARPLR